MVKVFYTQKAFPAGKCAPYQVKLDDAPDADQQDLRAANDDDDVIRRLRRQRAQGEADDAEAKRRRRRQAMKAEADAAERSGWRRTCRSDLGEKLVDAARTADLALLKRLLKTDSIDVDYVDADGSRHCGWRASTARRAP